jgi:hypothetical protein
MRSLDEEDVTNRLIGVVDVKGVSGVAVSQRISWRRVQ